jgi:integrase
VDTGQVDRTSATVGQLLDRWIQQIEPVRKPSTILGYKRKIEHDIRPLLGDVPLAKLGADSLDACYAQWLARPLATATVRQNHAILAAALHQALKWGWIDRNPADQASPPPVRSAPMKVPTPDQLSALVEAAEKDDPVLATAIALAALTGARRGELVALRWSDIDMTLGTVNIQRAITVVDGITHEGSTKTHQTRDVALDDVALGVLRQRWAYMTVLAQKAESALVDDPYVLSYNANGARPTNPDTITHRFATLCSSIEKAEANRRKIDVEDLPVSERWPFRFHDLRHFSVTTLIAAGIDVRTVAQRHGHAQTTMTLNRYAHALPERDRAAAGILGKALSR